MSGSLNESKQILECVLSQKKLLDGLIDSLAGTENLDASLFHELETKTRIVEQALRRLRKQVAKGWFKI